MLSRGRLKQIGGRLGLLGALDWIRYNKARARWIRDGYRGPAPALDKMKIIDAYRQQFGLGCFVETGTYLGDTVDYLARSGIRCISIELSPDLYDRASARFRRRRNISLKLGDSAKCLPEVLGDIQTPTLFWLDGHYSAGITARGNSDTPISEEMRAILDHHVRGHVVLIDDARCFCGKGGYPHLDELLAPIRKSGLYTVEISTDIIRLTPTEGDS